MKAAIQHKNGDPTTAAVLSVDQVPKPTAGADEVLVKVSCASINPIDYKLMTGAVPVKRSGPAGFDVSGVVAAVGASVTNVSVGESVYADAARFQGAFAEYVRVDKDAVARMPRGASFREAAALPLAGLTALQGLTTQGGMAEGSRVAILGGSGGVGSFAVQMAKALGAAEVVATGSSVEMIAALGADRVVNYKEEDIGEALRGMELDLVFDTVGGVEGWVAAKGALKKGGRFVTVAGDGGSFFAMAPGIVFRKVAALFGAPPYIIFLTKSSAPTVGPDMAKITEMVEAGKVKPVVDDRVFELTTESMHEMCKAMMSHRTKGKLVMTVAE